MKKGIQSIEIGTKFQYLEVIEFLGIFNHKSKYRFRCECGNIVDRSLIAIRNAERLKYIISCGCIRTQRWDDISGQRFGNLIALEYNGTVGKHASWICVCDCGNETIVTATNLKTGNTTSCGCNWIALMTTHGQTHTRIHNIWGLIKQRCFNPNDPNYHNYGGRGIIICDRWIIFENFYEDMGESYNQFYIDNPTEIASIERINVNGNYELSNCEWIPLRLQSRNTRVNITNLQEVEEIRQLYTNGASKQYLADRFKMKYNYITEIVDFKIWKP
jgi:hypothetical protein